jgi:chromosome segregation protein
MHFKQIELAGFKSFADRTSVRLEKGITAIVGPNGCGKSNILDALRWSLGEQSAKALRGTHMQDVIFNGSDTRQSIGMAEVSLTFDNADNRLPVDFAEVQVTRRVYRSGESEYLLNKAPCRLKDIQELFMDTGIGTNAYSLIGQGKISMVLSSKPEDRRFLFEEAAGIIRYKSRKRVAMRKLESADQNILRLNDIVAEVQRQIRSLKRQVNAAIRYREMSEELRGLEIRSAWLKFTMLRDRVAQLRAQFAEAQDCFEKSSAELTEQEAAYEALGLKKLEVDRTLMARREGVHEIETEMEKLERQIALLNQQIDFSKSQQAKAEQERAEFLQRADDIKNALSNTGERSDTLSTDIVQARAALDEKQQAHTAAMQRLTEVETQVEALRALALERMNSRARTHTELEKLGVAIENIDAQLKSIFDRELGANERRHALAGTLEQARAQETERHQALEDAEQRRDQAEQQQTLSGQQLREVNEKWQTLREQKSSMEARLNSLRELRDNYEGFAIGVRAVMRAKQENMPEADGVIGPAGDLLSTEKTYERAIEAALGGNINNVVVKNSEAAKAAVDFLKRHKAGRVTFLPLDIIRGGTDRQSDAFRTERGVIGPAIDFVQFDPYLQRAIEYLLHSTLIVETLDDAIRIARGRNQYPRMVTLDGEMVSSSGAVTGGRNQRDTGGLLGRSAEIDELEDKVGQAEKQAAWQASEGQKLTVRIQQLRVEQQEAEKAAVQLRREVQELNVQIGRQATELDSLNQSADSMNHERDELMQRREEFEEQRRDASTRADSMVGDEETQQQRVASAQEAAAEARQAVSACAVELADLRVKLAEMNQSLEEANRNQQRENREHAVALEEAERRKTLRADLEANQKTLQEEIAQYIEHSKGFSERKEEAHAKVVETQNERKLLLDQSDVVEKRLRTLRDQSRGAQSEVHKFEMALRHDEDQIGFFTARALEEYRVALASLTADEVGTDEYDEKTRDDLVADLRNKIERMGPVNLTAIEEFDALTERSDFLVAQSEDLQQARQTLYGVLDRIDKTIREMFMSTFEEVANHFREYFRRLFNGGHARIYLLNEDDPLESGIEIEARPPGKKPTSISLLSGGESAMTAIALLFSIFRAKPSPFCVLDEVDAPLDDANIGRFLTMVEEFTEHSQFIIITHNKQTMARAAALYGVTMQEQGVSKLVSVRFADTDDSESAA